MIRNSTLALLETCAPGAISQRGINSLALESYAKEAVLRLQEVGIHSINEDLLKVHLTSWNHKEISIDSLAKIKKSISTSSPLKKRTLLMQVSQQCAADVIKDIEMFLAFEAFCDRAISLKSLGKFRTALQKVQNGLLLELSVRSLRAVILENLKANQDSFS